MRFRSTLSTLAAAAGLVAVTALPAQADHWSSVDLDRGNCYSGEISNPTGTRLQTDRYSYVVRPDGTEVFTCVFDVPTFVSGWENLYSNEDWTLPRRATVYETTCVEADADLGDQLIDGTLRITPGGRGILRCEVPAA